MVKKTATTLLFTVFMDPDLFFLVRRELANKAEVNMKLCDFKECRLRNFHRQINKLMEWS